MGCGIFCQDIVLIKQGRNLKTIFTWIVPEKVYCKIIFFLSVFNTSCYPERIFPTFAIDHLPLLAWFVVLAID